MEQNFYMELWMLIFFENFCSNCWYILEEIWYFKLYKFKKLSIILDNASSHSKKLLRAILRKFIKLFFLTYTPRLNSIEKTFFVFFFKNPIFFWKQTIFCFFSKNFNFNLTKYTWSNFLLNILFLLFIMKF